MNALPMADLTVIDLTRHRAGPVTSRLLADWGATVIKIEEPTDLGDSMGGPREGFDYQNLHRNKRSLSVDLKSSDGQAILKRLVAKADVVLENFRPEVKFRLGVDYASLKALNPTIICGSISGFGQQGPLATRPAVDQIIQGMSGLMSVTGTDTSGPLRTGVAMADVSAGMNLAIVVLMALYERQRTQQGQWVTTSLLESTLAMMDFQVARWLHDGQEPERVGNDHPTLMPTGVVHTQDGTITLAAAEDDKFRVLCEVLSLGPLDQQPEYRDVRARHQYRHGLMAVINAATRQWESASLIEKLNARGIPSGPVLSVEEAMNQPQMRELNMVHPMTHPQWGSYVLLGQPMQMSAHPDGAAVRAVAPGHGEHTYDLLTQTLGFTEEQVAQFVEREAIAIAPRSSEGVSHEPVA